MTRGEQHSRQHSSDARQFFTWDQYIAIDKHSTAASIQLAPRLTASSLNRGTPVRVPGARHGLDIVRADGQEAARRRDGRRTVTARSFDDIRRQRVARIDLSRQTSAAPRHRRPSRRRAPPRPAAAAATTKFGRRRRRRWTSLERWLGQSREAVASFGTGRSATKPTFQPCAPLDRGYHTLHKRLDPSASQS